MVKFGGEIGTLYQMLKNAFKKHPLQNRTNVQIKGGGGQRPFEQCLKKLHFSYRGASLIYDLKRSIEWLKRWPRRDVQPVCRKRSSVMSTKVESGERAVWASLFFPTSRATHAAQQLSSGQKWASGGQLWLCGRQGSIG